MESQELEPKKVELPNRCLGVDHFGKYCETMLPEGRHTCSICQRRINLSAKLTYSVFKKEYRKNNLHDI